MQHNFILDSGLVKRFHTVDTIKSQNVAAHSFGVAWLCDLLTDGKASKYLIMAALSHDLAESVIGDIPSPAKRKLGLGKVFHDAEISELRALGLEHYTENLTNQEKFVLKLADNLEGMYFCLREKKLGNRSIEIVFDRFRQYTREVLEEGFGGSNVHNFNKSTMLGIFAGIVEEWEDIQ
jgi:5'-deoxynucleotidase YfbR-like HD superfamily hydrolase